MASLSDLYKKVTPAAKAALNFAGPAASLIPGAIRGTQSLYASSQPVRDFAGSFGRSAVNAVLQPSVAGDPLRAGESAAQQRERAVNAFNSGGNNSLASQAGNYAGNLAAVNPVAAEIRLGNNLGNVGTPAQLVRNPGKTAGAFADYAVNRFTGQPEVGIAEKLGTTPVRKLAAYGTVRGLEVVGSNQARSLSDTGKPDPSVSNNLKAFGTGATLNTVLSPVLAFQAAKSLVDAAGNYAGTVANQKGYQLAGELYAKEIPKSQVKIGNSAVRVNGKFASEEIPTLESTVSVANGNKILLDGKYSPQVNKPGDLSGPTITIKSDPRTGEVLSWTTNDPNYLSHVKQAAAAPSVSGYEPSSNSDVAHFERARSQAADPNFDPSMAGAQFRVRQPQESVLQPTGKSRERGFVTNVKGSPRSAAQVAAGAEGNYDRISVAGTMENASQLVSENPEKALVQVMSSKGYDGNVSALGQALMEKYQKEGNYEQALSVFDSLKTKATESGQANALLAYWNRLSPEGVLRYAAKEVDKATGGKSKLTAEQAASIREKAHAAALAATPEEKAAAQAATVSEIEKAIPTAGGRKAMAIIKAGFLSGLKTSARNIIGNTVNGAAELAAKAVGSGVDSAASLATGKRTLSATFQGLGEGFSEGLKAAKSIFKDGYDPNDPPAGVDKHAINWGDSIAGKAAKAYTDTVFRFLDGQDKPFYYAALKNSLYEQAKVAAINSGAKDGQAIARLAANPTDRMVSNAVNDAERATFKNRTGIGAALSKAKQEIRSQTTKYAGSTLGNLSGDIADYLLPFTQVPAAAASQGVAYSPAGLIQTIVKNIGKGNFDQRDFSQGLGRGLTGTALYALGAELAGKGMVSFAYPTDAREQEQWKLEKRQPYSLKVGGKWVPLSTLGPQAQSIITGAASAAGGGSFGLATFGKQINDQPFLQGISSVTGALADPERAGSTFVNSAAAGFVPTLVGDIAKATDLTPQGYGTQREANGPLEAIQAKIPANPLVPGRTDLLPQRDAFGNVLDSGKGPAGTLVNPFNSTVASTDPAVLELRRLMDSGNAATPTKLGGNIKSLGANINLDPAQLDQLEQRTGGEVTKRFSAAISDPSYALLSDSQKASILNGIVSDARDSAKKGVVTGSAQSPLGSAVPPGNSLSAAPSGKGVTKDQLDAAKFLVESGQKESVVINDRIVTTDPSTGAVVVKSLAKIKSDAEAQALANKIETAKRDDDYSSWFALQKQLYESLQRQSSALDPALDQAKVLANQNKLADIAANVAKYQSYGGSFSKPRKVRKPKSVSVSSARISAPKAARAKVVQPKVKSAKVKLAKTKAGAKSFKA